MSQSESPTALAKAAGISVPYASMILSKKRTPSRSLAIHILRTTGWRTKPLDGLSDEQIAMLETVEPWSPSEGKAA